MYDVVKQECETDKQVYVTQLTLHDSCHAEVSDAHTIQNIENIVHVIHKCVIKP